MDVPAPFGTRHFSDAERQAITNTLSKYIPPELLSFRKGYGSGDLAYIEGRTAIELGNQIFGFNGWSSNIVDLKIVHQERNKAGRWSVGATAIVRILLKDGSCREDLGFGNSDNPKREKALENSQKEAITDGIKRAMRQFGSACGGTVYDKRYIQRVQGRQLSELDRNRLLPANLSKLDIPHPTLPLGDHESTGSAINKKSTLKDENDPEKSNPQKAKSHSSTLGDSNQVSSVTISPSENRSNSVSLPSKVEPAQFQRPSGSGFSQPTTPLGAQGPLSVKKTPAIGERAKQVQHTSSRENSATPNSNHPMTGSAPPGNLPTNPPIPGVRRPHPSEGHSGPPSHGHHRPHGAPPPRPMGTMEPQRGLGYASHPTAGKPGTSSVSSMSSSMSASLQDQHQGRRVGVAMPSKPPSHPSSNHSGFTSSAGTAATMMNASHARMSSHDLKSQKGSSALPKQGRSYGVARPISGGGMPLKSNNPSQVVHRQQQHHHHPQRNPMNRTGSGNYGSVPSSHRGNMKRIDPNGGGNNKTPHGSAPTSTTLHRNPSQSGVLGKRVGFVAASELHKTNQAVPHVQSMATKGPVSSSAKRPRGPE